MNPLALTALVCIALPVLAGVIFIAAVINHAWQHRHEGKHKEDAP